MAFDASAYGRHISSDYDELYADLYPWESAVDTLVELAAGGPVLELGIGTGRLALPMLERGLEVHGIEGSAEMAQVLKGKPRGTEIPVTVGDFAEVAAGKDFSLVVLAVNTIFALPSQDAQVRCFRNVAQQLRPGGLFAVEAWVPNPAAFTSGGGAVRPVHVGGTRVVLEAAQIRPAEQLMSTCKVFLGGKGVHVVPANHRYAWPSELDLMARLAGLVLADRWEDWERRPYGDESRAHVSVWRKDFEEPW